MSCACSSTSAEGYGPAFWVPAGTSASIVLETLAAPTAPGLDLTDATPYLRVRTSPTATDTKLEAAIGDGLVWLDQLAGVLRWDIVPADFSGAGYTPGTPWYYEFGYTLSDGSAYIPDHGIGELYLDKVRPATAPSGLQIAWMPFLRARAVGPDGSPTPIYASTAYVDAAVAAEAAARAAADTALVAALVDRGSATNADATATTVAFPAGARIYSLDLVFTGAAGARTVVLETSGRVRGDKLTLDYTLPATAGLVIELRNATAGGTLLDTLATDATGDSAALQLTYTGTVWELNSALYPSN